MQPKIYLDCGVQNWNANNGMADSRLADGGNKNILKESEKPEEIGNARNGESCTESDNAIQLAEDNRRKAQRKREWV